jgi:signal peptidase I
MADRSSASRPAANTPAHKTTAASVKETLISVVIAFTMAFVFRGFVIEGFQIPTGSMAPTLLGKHMLVVNPETGTEWTVGPWDYLDRGQQVPAPVQGQNRPIRLNDPDTGAPVELVGGVPTRAGDRLFVLKYLRGIYEPKRWDVIVFKAPHVHNENYIKRLLGLPGEQLALVDGDVFARPLESVGTADGAAAWAEDGWQIQRKPERAQRAMWREVFNAAHTPENPSRRFLPPWSAAAGSWTGLRDARVYEHTGPGRAELEWDAAQRPIDDYTAYNQLGDRGQAWDRRIGGRFTPIFPVSDVSVGFGLEPTTDTGSVEIDLSARGMGLRATLTPGEGGWSVSLDRRSYETDAAAWTTLASADGVRIAEGRATGVEFWHVDQALWLFVDGELVAGGPEQGAYDLSPAERVRAATGRGLTDVLAQNPSIENSPLGNPRLFRRPELSIRVDGPVKLHDTTVQRDVHYQISPRPTLGGHPDHFPTLDGDHYFMAGDNSPSSLDGRLWDTTDPWVAESIEHGSGTVALVHRDLVIGRAFVVYFPSPLSDGPIPMLDFGRMRWIW